MRDVFCSSCGAKYSSEGPGYHKCSSCGIETWANAIPVVVGLIPVKNGMKIGLLIIQRAIEPGLGKWAFPGGFLELEDWKAGLSREIKEEINLDIHPADIRSSGFVSTYPNPNRVLLFGITRAIEGQERAAFEANDEVSSIYTLYTVEDVNKVNWAFPIHKEFALKFFEERI